MNQKSLLMEIRLYSYNQYFNEKRCGITNRKLKAKIELGHKTMYYIYHFLGKSLFKYFTVRWKFIAVKKLLALTICTTVI